MIWSSEVASIRVGSNVSSSGINYGVICTVCSGTSDSETCDSGICTGSGKCDSGIYTGSGTCDSGICTGSLTRDSGICLGSAICTGSGICLSSASSGRLDTRLKTGVILICL
ncbi:hypothetical protein TNCV_903341 [Trichonephila clavipes]|nr:hypothetical protein TNCV_903341 [Trichonephila clavipes]